MTSLQGEILKNKTHGCGVMKNQLPLHYILFMIENDFYPALIAYQVAHQLGKQEVRSSNPGLDKNEFLAKFVQTL